MFTRFRNYFYSRISQSKKKHSLYILPTLDGLKVLCLNLLLLVVGLLYANNYVLLFNFVLFSLFLSSMYYTHFNLSKIELLGLQVPWIHTNEDGQLTLFFKTKNFYGNHFVRASFKNSFFEINSSESAFSLSLKEKKTVTLLIRGLKRGAGRIETIYIESTFPFNFFRTFTFFKVNCDFVVYPERRQLNLHQEVSHPMASTDAEDDFILENYIRGDSLKRIDWKKLAQSNQWYTKKFQAPKKDPIILTCESLPSEEILSSICFSLYKLHYKNIEYGLKLSEQLIISPAHSTGHLKRCLFALATHET